MIEDGEKENVGKKKKSKKQPGEGPEDLFKKTARGGTQVPWKE